MDGAPDSVTDSGCCNEQPARIERLNPHIDVAVFPALLADTLSFGGRTLNGTSTTIRRSANQEIKGFRNFMWMSMLMSLAVVFFGMQLMMVGPLKGRLDGIQSRLENSEKNMSKLVAARDSVWKTNDMLSGLQEQAGRLDQLKTSIADIQTLRNRVQNEAEAATIALSAVDRIVAVQNRIISEQQLTQQASQQLASLHQLQSAIIRGSEQTDVAVNSLDGIVALQNRVIAAANGYENASRSIAQLAELTQQMVAQSDDLKVASDRFDQFVALKDAVNRGGADLAVAQQSADQLVSIKNDVLSTADSVETAREHARTLVAMNNQLSSNSLRLNLAQQNLDAVVHLTETLSEQTAQVAAAIQNIEIMDDFQTEVATHVRSLESLRKTMLEIAMMESTVGRVARVIEPLAEIGNLRRLSEVEVREAARVILDRRMTRFSQNDTMPQIGATSAVIDSEVHDEELVPLPPEARQ